MTKTSYGFETDGLGNMAQYLVNFIYLPMFRVVLLSYLGNPRSVW